MIRKTNLTMRNVSSTAVSMDSVAADKRGKIHADGASAVRRTTEYIAISLDEIKNVCVVVWVTNRRC